MGGRGGGINNNMFKQAEDCIRGHLSTIKNQFSTHGKYVPSDWKDCASKSFAVSGVVSFLFSRLSPTAAFSSATFAAAASLLHSVVDSALERAGINPDQAIKTSKGDVSLTPAMIASAGKIVIVLATFAFFDRGPSWRGHALLSCIGTVLCLTDLIVNSLVPEQKAPKGFLLGSGNYFII